MKYFRNGLTLTTKKTCLFRSDWKQTCWKLSKYQLSLYFFIFFLIVLANERKLFIYSVSIHFVLNLNICALEWHKQRGYYDLLPNFMLFEQNFWSLSCYILVLYCEKTILKKGLRQIWKKSLKYSILNILHGIDDEIPITSLDNFTEIFKWILSSTIEIL